MGTFSYAKHIKTVLNFLPCSLNHSLINEGNSIRNSLLQVSYVPHLCLIHNTLHITQYKEVQGMISGEQRGHEIGPSLPIHRSENVLLRN